MVVLSRIESRLPSSISKFGFDLPVYCRILNSRVENSIIIIVVEYLEFDGNIILSTVFSSMDCVEIKPFVFSHLEWTYQSEKIISGNSGLQIPRREIVELFKAVAEIFSRAFVD